MTAWEAIPPSKYIKDLTLLEPENTILMTNSNTNQKY